MSGYEAKKIFAAFQTSVLDDEFTDCKTDLTLDFILNKNNYKLFLYRYIVVNGKLIELNLNNINNYIDQKVKIRSPLFCQGKKICNICAGNLYYKLGIRNIGLTVSKMAGKLLNANMKAFHDSSVKTERINFFDYIN